MDYLRREENVGVGNMKSAECINSYLSVLRLKEIIEGLLPRQAAKNLLIFSRVTLLIKMWAKQKGIYNYNLGYLNGISIMILVVRSMQIFYSQHSLKVIEHQIINHFDKLVQVVIENFFHTFSEWPWEANDFRCRAVTLIDIEQYMLKSEMRSSGSFSEMQTQEVIQSQQILAHLAQLPILSPFPPFKCTTSQMTSACKNKILKEIAIARQHIWLAHSNYNQFEVELSLQSRKRKHYQLL